MIPSEHGYTLSRTESIFMLDLFGGEEARCYRLRKIIAEDQRIGIMAIRLKHAGYLTETPDGFIGLSAIGRRALSQLN